MKKGIHANVRRIVKEIKEIRALRQNEIESKLKEFKETLQRCDESDIFPEFMEIIKNIYTINLFL